MMEQTFVSDGVMSGFGNIDFLTQLPAEHAHQRESSPRGVVVRERKAGAFVSEHRISGPEINVREEYVFGQLHRFYVMTGRERHSDIADFLKFEGLAFGEHEGVSA